MDINELWTYACSGNIAKLKEYYNSPSKVLNQRFKASLGENSLIMGAFRNEQYETVEYLISVGETLTPKEKERIVKELKKQELLSRLAFLN